MGCSSKSDEEKFVENFFLEKKLFLQIKNYIDSTYNDEAAVSTTVRKTFLRCKNGKKFSADDYRICDSWIYDRILSLNIMDVSLEKGGCIVSRPFGEIVFQIAKKPFSASTCYYQYNYCNENSNLTESMNSKNIPLGDGWSLFIEKN